MPARFKRLHIGLIGGIGAAAAVVCDQRLCAAVARTGQPLDLTIVQADIQTRIRNNLADRRQEQAQAHAPLLHRPKATGCDCAAIAPDDRAGRGCDRSGGNRPEPRL